MSPPSPTLGYRQNVGDPSTELLRDRRSAPVLAVHDALSSRPRKVLGWRAPAEAIDEQLWAIPTRRHSALGYLSPFAYERAHTPAATAA